MVADDRDVEERLEDAVLRREQPVDGGRWDVGQLADGLHRRRPVAALEEELARRLDDGGAGQAGPGLVRPGSGASGLSVAMD